MGDAIKTDMRSRKIVFLSHCLLNQNAKAEGLAGYQGMCEPLILLLAKAGVGIIQFPCPEAACYGLIRPLGTDTIEQYDTAEYRSLCRRMAKEVVGEVQSYQKAGYQVAAILGVEGSPSCSVDRAPRLVNRKRRLVRGSGLFLEALKRECDTNKLKVPFIGVPECTEAGDFRKALEKLSRTMK